MNLKSRLPRHSKRFRANLRMPRPLWMWGLPKASQRSQRASRHSARWFFGRAASRLSTSGSRARGFFKQLLEFFVSDELQLAGAAEFFVPAIRRAGEGVEPAGGYVIFPLSVISGFDFHFAQGNDVGAGNDADVFAARGGLEEAAQVFLGAGDGKGLHIVSNRPLTGFCQAGRGRNR